MAKHSDPAASWRQSVIKSLMPSESAATSLVAAKMMEVPAPVEIGYVNLAPRYDVADGLPPKARELLLRLREISKSANRQIPDFSELQEASANRVSALNVVNRLLEPAKNGGFALTEEHGQVITARRALNQATETFERMKALRSAKETEWQAAAGALGAIESWLSHGKPAGTVMIDGEIEAPKPKRGENSLLDQVENRRRRIREIDASLHSVRCAPFFSAYCAEKLRAKIMVEAERGRPDLSPCIEHDADPAWPMMQIRAEIFTSDPKVRGFAAFEIIDANAVHTWLHRDSLLAALDREFEKAADDGAALTIAQRAETEAELLGDRLACEMEESALVWAGITQNLPLHHRAACSPAAVLQVRLETVAGNGRRPAP